MINCINKSQYLEFLLPYVRFLKVLLTSNINKSQYRISFALCSFSKSSLNFEYSFSRQFRVHFLDILLYVITINNVRFCSGTGDIYHPMSFYCSSAEYLIFF